MCDKSYLRHGLLKMTLSLYNNPHIPRDGVQDIISMIENIIAEFYVPFLQQTINTELENVANKDTFNLVKIVLEDNKYPLKEFSTEHHRFKMYEKYSCFTQPQSHKIVENIDFVDNNITKITPVYATIIPIKNILQNILNIPGLFREILNYVQSLKDEKVEISNIYARTTLATQIR